MNLIDEFQEHICPICSPAAFRPGFTTWFRVKPESAQVLAQTSGATCGFRQRIRDEIKKKNYQEIGTWKGDRYPINITDPLNVYGKGSVARNVCVSLFFGLSERCTDKDVDNMAKAFLDAIKGNEGLISDDAKVTHLEILKRRLIPKQPSDDNYLVGVRISLVKSTVDHNTQFEWAPCVPII